MKIRKIRENEMAKVMRNLRAKAQVWSGNANRTASKSNTTVFDMSNLKKKANGGDNTISMGSGSNNHNAKSPGEVKASDYNNYGNTYVSDKDSVTSNAGNNGLVTNTNVNASAAAAAVDKVKMLKQQLVLRREIVNATEFVGEGSKMYLNLTNFNPKAETKYGICLQFSITHPGYPDIQRIWNVKSVRAQNAILPLMEEALAAGKTSLFVRVWTTGGIGTNTQYHVEKLN